MYIFDYTCHIEIYIQISIYTQIYIQIYANSLIMHVNIFVYIYYQCIKLRHIQIYITSNIQYLEIGSSFISL